MNRRLLCGLLVAFQTVPAIGQISGPPTTPINTPTTFSTTSGGTNYHTWVFQDSLDFSRSTTTVTNLSTNMNGTGSSTIVRDENGEWFVFMSVLAASGEIYRFEFGHDPTITSPQRYTAVTVPGANHLAIDVVRDDVTGNWHGFLVAVNTMWRLDFGNSLRNTPTVTPPMTFTEGIPNPRQITVIKDQGKWFAFVGNYLDKVGRFEFGNSLTNAPTNTSAIMPNSTYKHGTAVTGLGNYFALHKEDGKWYMVTTQYTLIYLLEFGPSLENTPTFRLLREQTPVNDPQMHRMSSIGLVSDCKNNLYGYVSQGEASSGFLKLNFNGSVTNIPTISSITGFTVEQLTGIETAVPFVANDGLYFVINYFSNNKPLRRVKVMDFPSGTAADTNSVTQSYAATGTYDVTMIRNMASPKGTSTFCHEVTVGSAGLPQPGPFTDSAVNVCVGQQQVRYTVPPVAGATGYNWSYSGTGYTINGSGNSITIDFGLNAQSGTLSVIPTNGAVSGQARTLAITVNPLPSVTVTPKGNDTICLGTSRQLTASQRAQTRYQWQHNGNNVGTNNRIYAATAAGVYKVIATDSLSGCAAASNDSVRLFTTTPPSASIANGTTLSICQGDSVTLNAQPTGAGLRYRWVGGAAAATDTFAQLVVKTAGSYRVAVIDARQCTDTSVATAVIVNARPTATIIPSGGIAVCQGDSVDLQAGTQAGASYLWLRDGAPLSGSVSSLRTGLSGAYRVVVTSPQNCRDTSVATNLSVLAPPVIEVTPADTSFCEGGVVNLQVNTQDTGLDFQWRNTAGAISGATADWFQTFIGDTYMVIASRTGIAGCADTAEALVTVHAIPNPNISWDGATLRADSGYATYEWFADGVSVETSTSHTYVPILPGTYQVRVTDINGCSAMSNSQNITDLAIHTVSAGTRVEVYPNPTRDRLHIVANIPVRAQLYTPEGRMVAAAAHDGVVELNHLSTGVYLLHITDMRGHSIGYERIIKFN
jgi:hypothetical protein